jgi:signal transduction histidine kinase
VFGSLRAKLIASFALVIFLSVFFAGSSFLFLLREYQTRLALNQLAVLIVPVAQQVVLLDRSEYSQAQVAGYLKELASESEIRILVLDSRGVVVTDTDGQLVGQTLDVERDQRLGLNQAAYWGTQRLAGGQDVLYVGLSLRGRSVERSTPRTNTLDVALVVPAASVQSSWLRLLPTLLFAGGISLLVSTIAAAVLARSIVQPIDRVTAASEQIARGNYDQNIEVSGQDEVGRLGAAFNRMAREVARSHRTMRDFLANVSHELKTPLTSIQGFSQAMVDGALRTPGDYAEAGQIISEESNRMRHLVDDLLQLSRLESGQVVMERQPLDLLGMLRASARRAGRLAQERAISLDLDLAALPMVRGDEHWLDEVFGNLLENALRHTPDGGRVTVRARSVGGRISVEVHNTGSYIPPEELSRVFERFYQVDRSRASQGAGLGLAIVREVVIAHGGEVEAKSSPDAGTTFVVQLPVGKLEKSTAAARAARS